MTDAITVVNNALARLGEKPITSLDQGTKVSDVCATTYPVTRDACLAAASWPFARMRQPLSRLVATPPSDFAYYYALPPMYVQSIEPNLEELSNEFRREVYVNPGNPNDQQGVIATNALSLTLVYVGRVSEGLWHPLFVRYVILALAVDLSQVITGKASLGKAITEERETALLQAKNKIAHEGTPKQAPLPTAYLDVRGLGTSAAPTRVGEW